MTRLADAFLAKSERDADRDELEAHLAARIDAATRSWPALAIDPERVASLLGTSGKDPFELDEEAFDEAFLALGCADGHADALRAFEERYLSVVPTALAHMKLDASEVDEVRQLVRERLLVADEGDPRIVGYAGRGSLRGLVKVVAVRAALDRLRRAGRDTGDAQLAELPSPERDPELAFLKEHYRAAFSEAFQEAIASLEQRERNLLRLHHLGGATLEELARMYGMHRATVVRQLAKVRERLFARTQKGMRERLRIAPRELESVMDLLRSRFDVSVERMLRSMESSRSQE